MGMKPKTSAAIPSLSQFNPNRIPFQRRVLKDIRKKFDYSDGFMPDGSPKLGVHQILLSGTVGSAKSLILAHIVVTHCLLFPGAQVGMGRLTMKDLRETLLKMTRQHIGQELPYGYNETLGKIVFANGSEVLSFSWADGDYEQFKSYAFSLFVIEELTETKDKALYDAIIERVGRLPNVPEKLIVCATNPDSPSHWAYKHFILGSAEDSYIHVYYSHAKDNPFIPASYYAMLRKNLDPRMALRKLEGQWIEITQDVIYYQYSRASHYKPGVIYRVDREHPIHISFDFNIAIGKPMSCVLYQVIEDHFHFFAELVVEGANTEDILQEAAERNYFEYDTTYLVHGDATGSSRSPASKSTNYDVIRNFLANYKTKDGRRIKFNIQVPKSNPPIRTRHNLVNAYMLNVGGDVRLSVYDQVKKLDEGFRLTMLKDGGKYLEDDSKDYQHITTAAGYGIFWHVRMSQRKEQGTVLL